jgi:hypothetical protein
LSFEETEDIMAYIPNRDDPLAPVPPHDELRGDLPYNEVQPDPELAEGPAGPGRLFLYAIAAIAILGAVFYGLNASNAPTMTEAPPAVGSSTAQNTAPPVRDVTPRAPNSAPGLTTGSAPAQPATPSPAPSAPTGGSGPSSTSN